MVLFHVLIRVSMVIVTLIFFAILFLAYLRVRILKMLLITVGFGIFVVNSIMLMLELLFEPAYHLYTEDLHFLVILAGLLFIVIGALKDSS